MKVLITYSSGEVREESDWTEDMIVRARMSLAQIVPPSRATIEVITP